MSGYKHERPGPDGWTGWFAPTMIGFRLMCCSCGLVHEMDFRIVEGEVEIRARRLVKETALARRRKGMEMVRRKP